MTQRGNKFEEVKSIPDIGDDVVRHHLAFQQRYGRSPMLDDDDIIDVMARCDDECDPAEWAVLMLHYENWKHKLISPDAIWDDFGNDPEGDHHLDVIEGHLNK